jgi:hypothetical protein
MDEGLPIAYEVLESGVLVYTSDRQIAGTVDHVVAAPDIDIFHGLVIRAGDDLLFVAAEHVQSLHERGVDLRIDAAAVSALPPPTTVRRVSEPVPTPWEHMVGKLRGDR